VSIELQKSLNEGVFGLDQIVLPLNWSKEVAPTVEAIVDPMQRCRILDIILPEEVLNPVRTICQAAIIPSADVSPARLEQMRKKFHFCAVSGCEDIETSGMVSVPQTEETVTLTNALLKFTQAVIDTATRTDNPGAQIQPSTDLRVTFSVYLSYGGASSRRYSPLSLFFSLSFITYIHTHFICV
jgi:hypothetical protein